ncbi:MAG TPA: RNA methyltransferase [Anaerolineales bacterium]|nr:RNA methyltransferase [Anaerolineales bacterium]
MTVITSSQNSKIKLVRALLGRPKERREANVFVIEGVRLVEEAVNINWEFQFALYSDGLSERGLNLIKRLEDKKIEVEMVESGLLQSLSETETPQGILAVLVDSRLPIPDSLNFILIPDQIRDPGNLGTLIRTAAATGVQTVLIPPETTGAFAPKVVRSGMGAHFRLPIHSMAWEEIRKYVSASHPLQVYLADMGGKSCWETDLRQPLALIVGGEAAGASNEARKLATKKISIPMQGQVESLNAGVAGSVLMFEVVRQRKTVG